MSDIVDRRRQRKSHSVEFPTELAREAQKYANFGFKVFPLKPGEKVPLGGHGHKDATSDPAKVLGWWGNHPNANIGLATGEFVVVDVDGEDGLRFLEKEFAVGDPLALSPVPLVQKNPNGYHLLFKRNGMVIRNDAKDIADGIDTRGTHPDGTPAGYIVAAPSINKSGERYRWLNFDAFKRLDQIPEMPRGLTYLAAFNRKQRKYIEATPELQASMEAATPQEWRRVWSEHRPRSIRSEGGSSRVPLEHPYVQATIDKICDEIASLPPGQQQEGFAKYGCFALGNFLQSCGLTDSETIAEVIERAVEAGLRMDNERGHYLGDWKEEQLREIATRCVWEGVEKGNRPPPALDRARPKERDHKGQRQKQAESKGTLKVTRLSDIEPEETKWLWYPFLARGTIAAVGGDPGTGKSQMMLDLAARVTKGKPFPDTKARFGGGEEECEPGSVILIAGEDDLKRTVAPRFQAAGGDARRLHVIQGQEETLEDGTKTITPLSLQSAIGQLDSLLKKIGDVRLVIIDPISAYMGKADAHKNAEVRGVLLPLQSLAEQHDCSIVYVMHLNKSGDRKSSNPLHRFTDSLAYTAAARGAFLISKDPSPQVVDGARLMTTAKNNLAEERGMELIVEGCWVESQKNGKTVTIPTSRVRWGAPTTITAKEAMGGDQSEGASDLEDAKEFLQEELAIGPRKQKDLEKTAKDKEISVKTLRRAKKALGIESARRSGLGSDGWWEWSLPVEPTPLSDESDAPASSGTE